MFSSLSQSQSSESVDLTYLEQYGNRSVYKLPTYFEKFALKPGYRFEARVSNIFDPSKFWLVIKFRELEAFQKYLFKFYYMNRASYRVSPSEVVTGLYCVCFTDLNYYRAVVTNVTVLQDSSEFQAQVHYVDFGMFGVINLGDIYHMNEKIVHVAQFAVRASLAGVYPASENERWTAQDALAFGNLVNSKDLSGVVLHVYESECVIDVKLADYDASGLQQVNVSQAMIEAGIAVDPHKKLKSKLLPVFPFMFPSHAMLESGKIPTTVADLEYQPLMTLGSYDRVVMEEGHHMFP